MPDFSAISDVISAVKNILDGVAGLTGSLGGDGFDTVLGSLGGGETAGDPA